MIVTAAMVLTVLCSKPIGAFELGEAYAASMGVDVKRYRVILILLSSLMSACVTAFAGPVSFVGIAVPFLMRKLLRSSRPPVMVGISTVTSLLGAPVVIYMLAVRKR